MADLFMGIMALINILVITILSPIAVAAIKDYMKQRKEGKNPVFKAKPIAVAAIKDYMKQRKEGKNPVFKAKNIPGLKNTECWD